VLDRIESQALAQGLGLPPPHPVTVQPRRRPFRRIVRAVCVAAHGHAGFIAWDIPNGSAFTDFPPGCRHCSSSADFTLVDSLTWVTAMQLFGLPGALITALISDRWQRKWWITILAVIIACCGLGLMALRSKRSPSSSSAD